LLEGSIVLLATVEIYGYLNQMMVFSKQRISLNFSRALFFSRALGYHAVFPKDVRVSNGGTRSFL